MGREFELKYRSDDRTNEALQAEYGPFTAISMETTYYDTPKRELSLRRWTLRRRYENGVSVCTVKTPGSNGSRGEWETECEDILSAVETLISLGAPKELAALTCNGVTEVCAARFTRMAALLQQEDCTVELALDSGYLMGGGRKLPFAEVEVELKSGKEAGAVRFAEEIAKRFCLEPEPKSKQQRARALVTIGEKEYGKS